MDQNAISYNALFLEEIRSQSSKIINIDGVRIKVCKDVFPPRSQFSKSSEKLHTIFGDLNGLMVLDMGTGTGVQAIQAANNGATEVVAIDISPKAVQCARGNVALNKAQNTVKVLESNLFEKIPVNWKFDVIIANLPISDLPIEDTVSNAIYDPGHKTRENFLSQVSKYLTDKGVIIMVDINFNGENDFEHFEHLLNRYRFKPERYIAIKNQGFVWRLYRIIKK